METEASPEAPLFPCIAFPRPALWVAVTVKIYGSFSVSLHGSIATGS